MTDDLQGVYHSTAYPGRTFAIRERRQQYIEYPGVRYQGHNRHDFFMHILIILRIVMQILREFSQRLYRTQASQRIDNGLLAFWVISDSYLDGLERFISLTILPIRLDFVYGLQVANQFRMQCVTISDPFFFKEDNWLDLGAPIVCFSYVFLHMKKIPARGVTSIQLNILREGLFDIDIKILPAEIDIQIIYDGH